MTFIKKIHSQEFIYKGILGFNYKVEKKDLERVMGSNDIKVHGIPKEKHHCENNYCTVNTCMFNKRTKN